MICLNVHYKTDASQVWYVIAGKNWLTLRFQDNSEIELPAELVERIVKEWQDRNA